jgi:hypothetical protein
MAINFPWAAYIREQGRQREREPDYLEQGLKGASEIASGLQDYSKRKQWSQTINQLVNSPNTAPEMKAFLPLLASNPSLANNLLPRLLPKQGTFLQQNPDGTFTIGGNTIPGQATPQDSSTTSSIPQQKMGPPVTAGVGGTLSPGMGGSPSPIPPQPPTPARPRFSIPITGNKAVDLLLKGVGGSKKPPAMDPSKAAYYQARATAAETGALSTIEKNIDPSVAGRNSPVGAAANSVRRAVNGLSLLQQPVVTKTAMEATLSDIDSILTQGSATVEGRRMLNSSNIYQNLAAYKSFVSSAPDKINVPPGVVNVYKNILTELAPISEKFVKDRVKQQGEFYRSRGEGLVGKKQYDDFLNRVQTGFSTGLPPPAPPGQDAQGGWSIQRVQ